MQLEVADLDDPQVAELIAFHQTEMQKNSPPGLCFPLGLSGLKEDGVTVWSVREDGQVAAIGAMRRHEDGSAEIKSMRTHPDFLRRGFGAVLLDKIIEEAKCEGFPRLSLETGSGEHFEAALALYRRRGFENGPAFADYRNTEFNQCLHLMLG